MPIRQWLANAKEKSESQKTSPKAEIATLNRIEKRQRNTYIVAWVAVQPHRDARCRRDSHIADFEVV